MTLNERLDKAAQLRSRGYNCAQSVIMCFEDITSLPEETSARISAALGTGVATCREICGVANAIAITIGTRHSADPSAKVPAAKEAHGVIERFAACNNNLLACRDLKGQPGCRSCNELVALGVELLDDHFRNNP